MDPVLVGLEFYGRTEVDCSSSGASDDFVSYDFGTGTLQGYATARMRL